MTDVPSCPTDSHGEPWAGRGLSDSGFSDDDGAAPALLATALAGGDPADVVAALLRSRVLVPVVATLDAAGIAAGGRTTDKAAHMSVVTVRGADGRAALPVFSSIDRLAAWDPAARPVPVAGTRAALAAYDEGAVALLLDPAGPHRLVLEGAPLRALAEGRVPVAPVEDPDVAAVIAAAASDVGLPAEAVRLRRGDQVDLVVEVAVPDGWSEEDAAAAGKALGRRLAGDAVLRSRLGRGLDLAVVGGSVP